MNSQVDLAEKLEAIPLVSDKALKFNDAKSCSCARYELNNKKPICPLCTVEFRLLKTNNTDHMMNVTTEDLIPQHPSHRDVLPVDVNMKLKNPSDNTLRNAVILRLAPQKTIHVVAYAQRGVGTTHARWKAAVFGNYKHIPDITISSELNKLLTNEQRRKVVNSCPPFVLKMNEAKQCIDIEDAGRGCTFCQQCVNTASLLRVKKRDDTNITSSASTEIVVNKKSSSISNPKGSISNPNGNVSVEKKREYVDMRGLITIANERSGSSIGPGGDRFMWTVESIGMISAESMVRSAFYLLKQKTSLFQDELIKMSIYEDSVSITRTLGTSASAEAPIRDPKGTS